MPSRVSMLSGQYPSALRITHMGVPVPEDIPILPQFLSPYGYTCANIGKLHFLPHANRDHRTPHPTYGFQHMEISDEPGVYEDAYREWVRQQAPEQMDRISLGLPPATKVWRDTMGIEETVQHPTSSERSDFRGAIPFPADDHLTHSAFVAEQTIEFLRDQDGQQPFLCIAGFYSPHAPWVVPQKYLALYDREALSLPQYAVEIDAQRPRDGEALYSDAQLRSAKHGYYAMISEVDEHIGRIIATLEEQGLRDNTVIVFTSDHGEWLGDHLKYGKGYPADDAVSRVPLIISAPKGVRGQTFTQLAEAVDIVPTLLDLAAIQIPPQLQGRSLAAALTEGEISAKDGALTEHHGWKSLRTARYRYLLHTDGREMLWDLEADPDAYNDVARKPSYQKALAECRHALLQKLIQMERPLSRTWAY